MKFNTEAELRGRLQAVELVLAELSGFALATRTDIDATAKELNTFETCRKSLSPEEFAAGQASTAWIFNTASHFAKLIRANVDQPGPRPDKN